MNKPVEMMRLSQAAYKQLEDSLQGPQVGDKTTDLQAGFQLGIQHVLAKLRNGFVVGA
jgi:histidinol phosphatase-like enzyme